MKKILSIILTILVATPLIACGGMAHPSEISTDSERSMSSDIENSEMGDTVLLDESVTSTLEDEARRLAFGKVLWDAYLRGTLPDGSVLDYISMESAANNKFAITDIDGDGQEELILLWEDACMAGMVEYVFGYNDGVVHVEFREFPTPTFYDNGFIEAGWSHNQGLAGEFWPYNVYYYDAKTDTYQRYGSVDAWDRNLREENFEGEFFPEDIDVDGNGLVYYILPVDWNGYDETYLVDGADYEKWRNAYLDGAEEISIPFQELTEENVSVLGYPKPDVQVPQPKG